jgi:hypothetical protein
MNWPDEILRAVLVQQRIEELDQGHLWHRHLPEVAASEDALQRAEASIGHPLDPLYRDFLTYADGWRSFYQDVDLFGTPQIMGSPPMDAALSQLSGVYPDDFASVVGMPKTDLLPIAASPAQPDMFLLGRPWARSPGVVVWYTGEVIDQFPDFDEFFLAMVDYNRLEIADLEAERRGRPRFSG